MEDNTKDSLLHTPQSQRAFQKEHQLQSKLLVAALLVILAVAVVVIASTFLFKSMQKDQSGAPVEEQKQTRQERLDSLYASENFPTPPEGKDPFNYGLDVQENLASSQDIRGHLLFSSVKIGSDNTMHIYTLDLADPDAVPTQLMPGAYPLDAFVEFMDVSGESDFLFNTHALTPQADNDATRFHRYNNESGEITPLKSVFGQYEKNVAYAPASDRLAYKRLLIPFRSYTDIVPIENWEVVVSDVGADEILLRIPAAAQPKWSPSGEQLLFLKADGLHVYDFTTQTDTLLVSVQDGQILSTSMFDVSPDGKYLVWTAAQDGVIMVHEITSWGPTALNEIGRISEADTQYYWPQFSPDNKFYVVQAIDKPLPGSVTRENPRFEIRSVLNRTVLKTIPIDEFDFNAFFTDTWVSAVPQIQAGTSENVNQ